MERKTWPRPSGTLALCRRRDTIAGWTLNSLHRPLARKVYSFFISVPVSIGHLANARIHRRIRMPPGIKAIQDNAGLKPALSKILQNGTTKKSADTISHCRIANTLILPPTIQYDSCGFNHKSPFTIFQFYLSLYLMAVFSKKLLNCLSPYLYCLPLLNVT